VTRVSQSAPRQAALIGLTDADDQATPAVAEEAPRLLSDCDVLPLKFASDLAPYLASTAPRHRVAVSFSRSNLVVVCDPMTGQQLGQLAGHASAIVGLVAYTLPDGSPRLASADKDGHVRLWDGESLAALHCFQATPQGVSGLLAYRDGVDERPRLFCGHTDGGASVWGGESGEAVFLISSGAVNAPVRTLLHTPSGEGHGELLVAEDGPTLRVYDAHTGALERVLEGHTARSTCLTSYFAPAPEAEGGEPRLHIVSGGFDRSVQVWPRTLGASRTTSRMATSVPARFGRQRPGGSCTAWRTTPVGSHRWLCISLRRQVSLPPGRGRQDSVVRVVTPCPSSQRYGWPLAEKRGPSLS
jgi:WD40 repeat protein